MPSRTVFVFVPIILALPLFPLLDPRVPRRIWPDKLSISDVSEEQLANVFSEAGPVQGVEIKFDPQTGRSKGYAFVQFYDESTAASAVRNLQEVPVNGRNLRVESSNDEIGSRRNAAAAAGGGGGGGGGGRRGGGGGGGGGYRDASPPRGGAGDHGVLPPGVEPPPGQKATDAISNTLAGVNPGQMQDVMTGMKTLITTQPDQARKLLADKPQLAYALFQAMLLLNLVDPSVLQRIQPLPPAAAPSAAPPFNPNQGYPPYPPSQAQTQALPPQNFPPYPPAGAGQQQQQQQQPGGYPPAPPQQYPPHQAQGYGGPPPPPGPGPGYGMGAALPPLVLSREVEAALATLPEDQRAMLRQVLQLSPEQVAALDPTQRASVNQLRQQFLGVA